MKREKNIKCGKCGKVHLASAECRDKILSRRKLIANMKGERDNLSSTDFVYPKIKGL